MGEKQHCQRVDARVFVTWINQIEIITIFTIHTKEVIKNAQYAGIPQLPII